MIRINQIPRFFSQSILDSAYRCRSSGCEEDEDRVKGMGSGIRMFVGGCGSGGRACLYDMESNVVCVLFEERNELERRGM
jgi:hypothetical protein